MKNGQSQPGALNPSFAHGHANKGRVSPTYNTWRAMLDRCDRASSRSYPRYGGRGISVCDRWRVFANFLADMGARPEGMTLDRTDVDGNYDPSNCRWASRADQSRNRTTTKLTAKSAELIRAACRDRRPNSEIAAEFGCHPDTVSKIRRGHQWAA